MSDSPTAQFSPEASDALARLLIMLADNKYRLGLRFAEWCTGGPTLESAVAAAALTQDELGHARSLYPLMRDFDHPPLEFKDNEAERDIYLNMACLERSFTHWADFVAASSIADQMLTIVFEAAADSTYAPLKQRVAKIMQEEYFHNLYAEGWCSQFAADPEARQRLQEGVDRLWTESASWFGPADDAVMSLLKDEGILDADAATLRQRFFERVSNLLGESGITLPISRHDDGWQLASELNWEQWDADARRLDAESDGG